MDGGSFDGCCAWELHLGLGMEGTVGSPGASDLELRPCTARLSSMLTRRLAAFALVCTDEAAGIVLSLTLAIAAQTMWDSAGSCNRMGKLLLMADLP